MKIYFVRHGRTESNNLKRLAGQRVDDELIPEGINQANELAQAIDSDFDVIFSSSMKRALQTAKIISEKINVPIIERKEIMERDYGKLSDKSWEEVGKETGLDHFDLKKQEFELTYDYRPYGGESAEDVKKRVLTFIAEVKKNYADKKVLVVAHGGIIRMAHFLFLEEKAEHIKNATIYEFDI